MSITSLFALAGLLIASAYTHYRGLNAVLAHTPGVLQDKGTEGKIRVRLRGISLRDGLVYNYVAKKGDEEILYEMFPETSEQP